MPDDQGVQPSSAQIDDYRGAQQLQKLKDELRRRIIGLRKMANVFLAFAIFVLVAGAGLFFYANFIARLALSPPQTAASQYAKLMDVRKRLSEQFDALDKKRQEILNVIIGPYNEKIAKIKAEYMPLEENILRNCPRATLKDYISDGDDLFDWDDRMIVTMRGTVHGYEFTLPRGDKSVSFENMDLANECKNHFFEHRNEMIQYRKEFNAVHRAKTETIQENINNKASEIAPLNQQRDQLRQDSQELEAALDNVKSRIAQEKYLGTTPTPEDRASSNTEAKIDWPHVIETNATRIGVVAAMFFLVTIFVPHYRYNIRMANFYQACYDSLEILPEKISAEEFDRVVTIMSPNIDFGKLPPTPWEHILEVVKAAK